jgi:hypothetical protein
MLYIHTLRVIPVNIYILFIDRSRQCTMLRKRSAQTHVHIYSFTLVEAHKCQGIENILFLYELHADECIHALFP